MHIAPFHSQPSIWIYICHIIDSELLVVFSFVLVHDQENDGNRSMESIVFLLNTVSLFSLELKGIDIPPPCFFVIL